MERSLTARRWSRVALAGFVLVVGVLAMADARGTGAAPAGVTPEFLCVSRTTGELRYWSTQCPSGYRSVDMAAGPVEACASLYTGQMRLARGGECPPGNRLVAIGDGSGALACASRYTGAVTYRASAARACNGLPLFWDATRSYVERCIDNYCPQVLADKSTLHTPLWFRDVPGTISDVNVSFDILHTSITDFEIELESPAGTVVELYAHHCYDAVDDLRVTFDDEAAQPIGAVCPPGGGSFRPAPGALSAFDGEVPNGTWIVRIADTIQGDNGQLLDWSIEIEVE